MCLRLKTPTGWVDAVEVEVEVVGVVKVIVVARGEVVKIVEVNPCPHEGATSPQLLGRHQEAKGLVHAAAKFREELWRSGLAWKSRAMWHSDRAPYDLREPVM